MRTLLWFRGKDLRLADHAPLTAALAAGEVLPLFVLDPFFFEPQAAQQLPHRMQFLLQSLTELHAHIAALGSRLLLVSGKSTEVVPALARRWSVDRVLAQRWCEPFARARDRRVAAALPVPLELLEGETLHSLGSLKTQQGDPFSVFTAFARAFARDVQVAPASATPQQLPGVPKLPSVPSEMGRLLAQVPSLAELGISANPRVLAGGEQAARERLLAFVKQGAALYDQRRDRMDLAGTSRLSADLKFGTLSARQVWNAVQKQLSAKAPEALKVFQNELVWREFTHATLWHRPTLLQRPFRQNWREFPWREDNAQFEAWCQGQTGYPVVDAAARQLLGEGFVHNRARMIAASFLTKHLLIDYRWGERHYLKWLTDGDWAQNNAGWQWSAGCGTDAQPYFRVFNPVTQGQKFDPEGDYVRRWVPELARLPAAAIHAPWDAAASVLQRAGVVLGNTYPKPLVEHAWARQRFLAVAQSFLKG